MLFSYVHCILCEKKKRKKENKSFSCVKFSFSLLQPIDTSSTNLAKQKEIEKEKEDLMDEGDFLEYKVKEEVCSKTCKSRKSD